MSNIGRDVLCQTQDEDILLPARLALFPAILTWPHSHKAGVFVWNHYWHDNSIYSGWTRPKAKYTLKCVSVFITHLCLLKHLLSEQRMCVSKNVHEEYLCSFTPWTAFQKWPFSDNIEMVFFSRVISFGYPTECILSSLIKSTQVFVDLTFLLTKLFPSWHKADSSQICSHGQHKHRKL